MDDGVRICEGVRLGDKLGRGVPVLMVWFESFGLEGV